MNVFDLRAVISLDKSEYESGLNDARKSGSSFASALGNGMKTLGKVSAVALSAAATGVAALTKMSVEGYAQYEQLVGGVETLFKESGSAVMQYAENAYKTAGLSANEYMETVTSFSASLIQSLDGDTAKAAEVANMAITDMADNANKMGTSIEMIQNAYNGFAKGNFTMLDNLKLGYGGTAEEMKRLLADAEKISGIKYDISSYADITEAIHVIQEDMGIAGATAAEAATTIEGSLGMLKASWQNLVVGMSDENANMETLINNFVESTVTAANNIMPRVEQALVGIGQLVEGLAPVIAEKLPGIIESVLPTLLTAAVNLVTSLANSLPGLLSSILPVVIQAAIDIGMALINTLKDNTGTLLQTVIDAVLQIVNGASETLPDIIAAVVQIIVELVNTLTNPDTLTMMLDAALGLIESLVMGLLDALPQLVEAAISLVQNLVDFITAPGNLENILQMCVFLVQEVVTGLVDALPQLLDAAVELIVQLVSFLLAPENLAMLIQAALDIVIAIAGGLLQAVGELVVAAGELVVALIEEFLGGAWAETGGTLVGDLWSGIKESWESVKQWFSDAWEGIKKGASDAWEGIKNVFSVVSDWFEGVFSTAWQKVKDVFSAGGEVFSGIKEGIETTFKTVVNALIDGINKIITIPFNAINDALDGIRSTEIAGWLPFSWLPTLDIPQIPHLSTGLKYVPYDEYPAFLHRGEAVLTAAEARAWRNGQMTPAMAGGITINQYIQSVPQTPVEFAAATEAYFEQARWQL